jgi:peptide/nickel transport system substrate-binding protein
MHANAALRCLLLVVAVVLTSCTSSPGRPDRADGQSAGPAASQTMTMAMRFEVTDFAPKIPGNSNPTLTKRLFNADLALIDAQGMARPYLAETLPELGTESWQLLPGSGMETTYRVRPGLTFHDGHALTAEDFVFAWRMYTAPGLAIFNPSPQDRIESVAAPDRHTLVIRWRGLYPEANQLNDGELTPLPTHILEPVLQSYLDDPTHQPALVNHPYWTTEYVGAGPFKLEGWERGTRIEGSAFAGHALGRPKIDRVIVQLMQDENAALAAIMAGAIHFSPNQAVRLEHALILNRDWVPSGKGTVMMRRSSPVVQHAQFRPEFLETPALLDLRVRKALAHSVDRAAISEAVFSGQGAMTETLVPESEPFYAEVDRATEKYAFNLRTAEQLMTEAGFTRDRDGYFASHSGERFSTELRVTASVEFERAQTVLAATWKEAGLEVRPGVLPAAQARNPEARHNFPGLLTRVTTTGSERRWLVFAGPEIGSPANRWTGENRSGWSNPEYDRLVEAYKTTLDRSERNRQAAQMVGIITREVAAIPTYFILFPNVRVANLHGPELGASDTLDHWNIHEWEFR